MDKLARQLREDAANIKVEVSAELDDRIRASLQGVTPERPRDSLPPARARSTWWASSLTGVAVVAAIILVLNLNQPEPIAPQNDTLVVAVNCEEGGGLRGYDVSNPGSGVPLWQLDLLSGCIESTPAIWKGAIYVGSRDGNFYAFK